MGMVKVAGYRLPQQSAQVRANLGVLSHQTLLYYALTGEENLQFFGRMYNLPDLNERIKEVLNLVDLYRRRGDLVRTYSRGMAQRLAIARAVLHDPQILLLDEPYTGLDQDASTMLDNVLRQIAGQGRTVVMTSHDLVRTAELCSRFDVLSRGRIIASAQRDEIPQDGLLAFYRQAIHQPEDANA
jgi:ABC-type multidrug transport system ATPase subunit